MLHASVLLETNDIISSHPTLPGNALSILEKLSGMPSTDSFGTADNGEGELEYVAMGVYGRGDEKDET